MGEDRYLAPDLELAAAIISSGDIVTAAGVAMPELSA
jgi:histidine ammonia-lyase